MEFLIEKLSGSGRNNIIIGAVAVVVILIAVVIGGTVLLGRGDGEEELPPVLYEESEILLRVQQTVEALGPTPTPTPTPDVAATLQAELEYNRRQVSRIVQLSPLDSKEVKNPYLEVREIEYLSGMGPVLWNYVQVWMHMRQVLSVDISEWSLGLLEYHLGVSSGILDATPSVEHPGSGDVGEVVRAYIARLVEGTYGVERGVVRLEHALDILSRVESGVGMDLEFVDREELGQIARDVRVDLAVFDDSMSKYGCSICGELFRVRPE